MPDYGSDAQVVLPLPAEGHGSLAYWTSQIKEAEEKRNRYKETEWNKNVQSFLGKMLDALPEHDTIAIGKDFANIERKKAELFFQNPEVNLTPKLPGLEDAVSIYQSVLNHYLGPHKTDAGAMMTEVTFDACVTGLMVSKIGYESVTDGEIQMQTGVREVPAAQPIPGAILQLATPPPQTEPAYESAPNIIHERYFWERASPAKVLIPTTFSGFVYDRAPWLGLECEDDWDVLKRRYRVSDDLEPRMGRGDTPSVLKSEREDLTASSATKRVRYWEIWYRAALVDPAVKHPDQLRYLVLVDGIEEPIKHADSPYQRTVNGKLMGMRGYPVHIGALRYVSDTAYPVAEATMSRPQVQELSKSRTQMMLQRDRNVPMRLVDVGRIGGEPGLDKLRRNIWQGLVPVQGLDANQPPVVEVHKSAFPPEDFQFNAIIGRDLDEIWAFGANQRGMETSERKTATEINNIQRNVSSRLDYERRHVIRYYVAGAEKLGSLLQLFADEQDYIEVVGQDGVRRLQAWNKDVIQGEYIYEARPDSAIRVDAAQEFSDLMEMYNLTGRDPHANRVEVLTRMARLKNLDPAKFIIPQLPSPKPEPPKISFAIKGEQLDPRSPNFPILIDLLEQAGYRVSPAAIQASQQHAQAQGQILNELAATASPASGYLGGNARPSNGQRGHPGAVPQVERLSKHQSERTHDISGPKTGGAY